MQHRAHNIICVEDGYQWVLNGGADPREPMLKRDKWMNSSLIDMRFTFIRNSINTQISIPKTIAFWHSVTKLKIRV